jgi:hypothetical protein
MDHYVYDSITNLEAEIDRCKYNQRVDFVYVNYKIKVLEILLVMIVLLFLCYVIKP